MVHGGEKFNKSVMLTEEVLKVFEECTNLAPLHNPANLKGVRAGFPLTNAPSSPTRSAPPDVITVLLSMSYSAYLIDEEPQFNTNIFII